MNENLNLVEILKDCPKGTKLYSTIWGDVEFSSINKSSLRPINIVIDDEIISCVADDGKLEPGFDGECTLFPSKEVRTWDNFKQKKPKFDPKILQPFDKVLARDTNDREWIALLFSHINIKGKCNVAGCIWGRVIPYNDDTKHLVGTTKEAPEFYRYWED